MKNIEDDEQDKHIQEFTMKELSFATDSHKAGKSSDIKGTKAEDLKGGDEETANIIHEIFILIIKQNSMTPSSWKKVMVTVIYQKGDATKQGNCKPICSLHYSCFSPPLYTTDFTPSIQCLTRQDSEKHSRHRLIIPTRTRRKAGRPA